MTDAQSEDALGSARNPPHSSALPGTRWFCVALLSNLERTAQLGLEELGFPTLFLRVATRYPGGKIIDGSPWKIRPAFPGYGLVGFDPDRDPWYKIADVNGVYRLFKHGPNSPTPLPVTEIGNLQRRADAKGVIYPTPPAPIETGTTCRPIASAFESWTGICEWSDTERVRILLRMFGREVPITLPISEVEVIF